MNIALPESLKDFVRERVSEGGYSSASEYIRELIRTDLNRTAKENLEADVLRGLRSGKPTPMTRGDWNRLRNDLRERHRKRKKA